MKVHLHPNYRWAWIGWPYGSDSVSAQYDIKSDYEVFNVRLFDPVTSLSQAQSFITNDAMVDEGNPDNNYGTLTNTNKIGSYSGDRKYFYLVVDFSSICSDIDTIQDAEFAVYHSDEDLNEDSAYSVNAYYCNDVFDESTLTWNNKDTEVTNCDSSPTYSEDMTVAGAEHVKMNFTDNATTELSDDCKFTIKLTLEGGTDNKEWRYLSSSEDASSYKPYFNITYIKVNTPPHWSENNSYSPSSYSPSIHSQFNVTWSDDRDSNGYNFSYIEINYTGTPHNYTTTRDGNTSYYKIILGAGTYQWKFYANDSLDKWNSTDSWTITINPAQTQTTLLINGTHSNRNLCNGTIANFTVYVNVDGKTVGLDTNITGWEIQTGITPLYNYTFLTESGTFNITGFYDGDANYSSSSDTLYLYVAQPSYTHLYLNGISADRYYEYGDKVQIKANVTNETNDLITPLQSSDFCLSIDAIGFGADYICDDNTDGIIEYNWTAFSSLNKVNDSDNETLSFWNGKNHSVFKYNKYDVVDNFSMSLNAFEDQSEYIHNLEIDVGNDSITDLKLFGDFGKINSDIVNESIFNNSEKNITKIWEGGTFKEYQGGVNIVYIRIPSNLNATSAYFNITADPNPNATRKAITLNWGNSFDRGGYNLSTHSCWAPVGGIIGSKYYQIGGKCTNPTTSYKNTIYYDIKNDEMGTGIDLPYDMTSGCSVSYDSDSDGISEEIYIFGGKDSGETPIKTVYKFDGSTYTSLASMPDARANTACVLIKDMVYVFGGDNATVIKYNITENSWNAGGNLATGTHGAMPMATQYNSTDILVWGGYASVGDGGNDIEFYNIETDTATDSGYDLSDIWFGGIGLSFKKSDGIFDIYHIGGWAHPGAEYELPAIYKFTGTGFTKASPDFNWSADWPSSTTAYDTIYQVGQSFGVYNGTLYASPNTYSTYESYLFRLKFFPQDSYIIVGDVSNNATWKHNGGMTSYEERGSDASGGAKIEEITNNFANDINNYIATHTCTYYCDIPVYIHSGSAGKITLQSLDIRWNTSDIILNVSAINNYLDNATGKIINVPFIFNSETNGTLKINSVKSYYYGSDNVTIKANFYGDTTYAASSHNQTAMVVYSNYTKQFPLHVYYLEFIPTSSVQDNITPYGQTNSTPIYNFTSLAYDRPINISVYWNDSTYEDRCANITFSLNNTREATDFKLTNISQELITNLSFGESQPIWAWLDLNASECNNPRWINIDLIWDSYCFECVR